MKYDNCRGHNLPSDAECFRKEKAEVGVHYFFNLSHEVFQGLFLHFRTDSMDVCIIKRPLFVYGRASGSAGSAFCFPYNSVTVRWILFKFGRFRQ